MSTGAEEVKTGDRWGATRRHPREPARLPFCYPAPGGVGRGRARHVRALGVDTGVRVFRGADRQG